jgi:hypothetical protein
MERIMGTKSWRYNRKIILLENDIRTICLKQNCHNIRNIGIIAGSAIVIFMVVAVAAIGAAWEAKSLKNL